MAKVEQIKALTRFHAEGDDTRFYAVPRRVALQAAPSNGANIAWELRDLAEKAKTQLKAADSSRTPRPRPLAEVAAPLVVGYPKSGLPDIALSEGFAERFGRVIREHHQRERLHWHGFSALRKLLLIGPQAQARP